MYGVDHYCKILSNVKCHCVVPARACTATSCLFLSTLEGGGEGGGRGGGKRGSEEREERRRGQQGGPLAGEGGEESSQSTGTVVPKKSKLLFKSLNSHSILNSWGKHKPDTWTLKKNLLTNVGLSVIYLKC